MHERYSDTSGGGNSENIRLAAEMPWVSVAWSDSLVLRDHQTETFHSKGGAEERSRGGKLRKQRTSEVRR